MNDFDRLLTLVISEAKSLKIPVSDRIDPHVRINSRAKTRLGCCIQKRESSSFVIELSSRLTDAPETACRQTLAHEIIHTCRGCLNHGELFKKYAAMMNAAFGYNISRTSDPEGMGVKSGKENAKYILVCKKCGGEFPRTRQSAVTRDPSRYRCSCGGELYLKGQQPAKEAAPELDGITGYLLVCTKCRAVIRRERMSSVVRYPSRYRCSCGGKLARLK